jgi:integrase
MSAPERLPHDGPALEPGAHAVAQALALAGQAMELAGLAAAAAGYALGSKSTATRRAYRADWAHFSGWCTAMGQSALPCDPPTLCLYLTAHAPVLTVATLQRRLASISQAHQAEGLPSPVRVPPVPKVWAGIVRAHRKPPVRKTPLVVDAMRACLDQLDDTARGRRDRCLLLLAWGGALRRSEVVALTTGDCRVEGRGLVLQVRRSKTDQTGLGRAVGLPYGRRAEYCPVRAWEAWAPIHGPRERPLFTRIGDGGQVGSLPLSDKHVARLVKRVADQAGLTGDYSGHSLRAGFATAAAAAGASERAIMNQTGHRSLLIARGYIRPATLFEDNAAAIAAL